MMLIILISGVFIAALLLQIKQPKDHNGKMEHMLPIWRVEQDCLLSKNGDITLAFSLTLPEIFTLSNEEYEALHHIWLKAIKVLPVNSILHKQDWFIKDQYKSSFKVDDDNFLMQSSDRFFNERPYLDHHCYLMLTLKPMARKVTSSAWSNLLRKNLISPDHFNTRQMQKLMESVGQFQRILSDSGFIQMQRLKEADLIGSELKAGLLEDYLYLAKNTGHRQLKDIQFKPDFKIGENHCFLYALADAENLPAKCSPRINFDKYSTDKTRFSVGLATPIGQLLTVNHIYNQYIVVGDAQKTIKDLESKRLRMQSLSNYSRGNAINERETSEYLNEAISLGRLPVKAHFNLFCWTENPDELKDLRNISSSALSQMGVVPALETVGAPQLWWAGIPGNEADLPENETFDTFAEQASCFFNMETAYKSSKSPFGIRLGDRLTGRPIHVDISDEPMGKVTTNRNKLVCGATGSGKSMFMNHLLHSYVQQGAHCIVVDVGHSYQGLCLLLGGTYFTYSEDDPICFNPFYLEPGEIMDTEKKESIKTLLVALWKQNDETFKRSEYVAISNAIQSYYLLLDKNPTLFPCFNTFYDFLGKEFLDELKVDGVKDRDFDVHNFLYVLRPYYQGGEFDYLLNATQNLDLLHQPFIVFELDNVKDHPILLPVITLIIMEMFISKMRKLKGVRKVITIEEAWKAVESAGMAGFMKYLNKTVRKHFGEVVTVTQEVDDIIGSPIIKESIVNSCDCKILLDMRKFQNKFEKIQELLGLTDKGRDLVLSLNKSNDPTKKYREVYIDLGNQLMRVYRFEPSPEEYYAYSTEQTEKLKVQEYTKKYGDIKKALRAIASEHIN